MLLFQCNNSEPNRTQHITVTDHKVPMVMNCKAFLGLCRHEHSSFFIKVMQKRVIIVETVSPNNQVGVSLHEVAFEKEQLLIRGITRHTRVDDLIAAVDTPTVTHQFYESIAIKWNRISENDDSIQPGRLGNDYFAMLHRATVDVSLIRI